MFLKQKIQKDVNKYHLKFITQGLLGGPVVKFLHFQCKDRGFNPWL